jgi:hypothetical protein
MLASVTYTPHTSDTKSVTLERTTMNTIGLPVDSSGYLYAQILPIYTTLTAVGITQATAFQLLNNCSHEFTTVATGAGAVLPPPNLPWQNDITVANNSAVAMLVYPPVGGSINAGTENASFSLVAGGSVTFWASSPTNWQNRQSGGGSSGGGGGTTPIVEVSQTTNFLAAANSFYAVSGSAPVTATLPTAVGIAGQTVRIRCANGYTGLCTIATTGGQTLGPASATSQIIYAGESALLQSDGANWARTGGTIIPCACRLSLGADQSIPQGADTLVLLSATTFDNTGQMAVPASNEIKIVRPGHYRATGGAYYNAMTNAAHTTYVNVSKNSAGGPIIFAMPIGPPGNPYALALNATGTQPFAAGDLITLHVMQANGGNTAETLTGGVGNGTFLEVEEIPAW